MAKNYFERLELLDVIIRRRQSGSADQIAHKLGVSRRTVFEYIEILKSLGADIEYDNYRKSYHYKHGGKFYFKFIKDQ